MSQPVVILGSFQEIEEKQKKHNKTNIAAVIALHIVGFGHPAL